MPILYASCIAVDRVRLRARMFSFLKQFQFPHFFNTATACLSLTLALFLSHPIIATVGCTMIHGSVSSQCKSWKVRGSRAFFFDITKQFIG